MTARIADQVNTSVSRYASKRFLPQRSYRLGDGVELAAYTQRHEPAPDRPLSRRLRVYALHPGVSRSDHGICTVTVTFEPLTAGPVGSVIEVSGEGDDTSSWQRSELESPDVIMQDGYAPSYSDPRFHQQMVYAVAMKTYDLFRTALGRDITWSFDRRHAAGSDGNNRLLLRPHGPQVANAWYDRRRGEIVFGYFKAQRSTSMVQAGTGQVFTCLSHDVIAHEMSHALIDGLRSHFMVPSHPDVPAFHEAFADLVAVFQHFTLTDIVRSAIAKTRGRVESAEVLVDVAQELGKALSGGGRALRTLATVRMPDDERPYCPACSEPSVTPTQDSPYDADANPHVHGNRLSSAVFSAFLAIYERRAKPLVKLATNGTGSLPAGELSADLLDALTNEVCSVAKQFLTICVRAIDYCPPVDVRYGDFLRALITADVDSVPDDRFGYRDAIIRAFGQHGIYGEGARSMGEDDLLWHSPLLHIEPIKALSYGQIQFDGDPARPVDASEMRRQAHALGELVVQRRYAREFGLVSPDDESFPSGGYELPRIESVRTLRRVGPDRSVFFESVAEVVQCRWATVSSGERFRFYGGSTLILDSQGQLRFIIRKRVDNVEDRLPVQKTFMQSSAGQRLWNVEQNTLVPHPELACQPGAPLT